MKQFVQITVDLIGRTGSGVMKTSVLLFWIEIKQMIRILYRY